jgi:hypothetical protein
MKTKLKGAIYLFYPLKQVSDPKTIRIRNYSYN